MRISLDDQRLSYSGRIDVTDPGRPEFIFPATSLTFRFTGRQAVLTVENLRLYWDNFLGGIIDGEQKAWKLNPEGETRILLVSGKEEACHEITVFKRQDCCHEVVLSSLELSAGSVLHPAPEKPWRRMEVFGDSVSAGEVSEAVDWAGKLDPPHQGEYSNSWYSYAWIAARMLGAELHDTAQGGIPLLNHTGWFAPPAYPGMEFMWDKLHYHPELGKVAEWDFSRYQPQLVVIAIGQNDSNPEDYMASDPDGEKADRWKREYRRLAESIREKYPEAVIILATTILCHHENWDRAIGEVCRQMNKAGDGKVYHFLYRRNGKGTPGHIRIPEAEEMAGELVSFVKKLEIPGWEEKD